MNLITLSATKENIFDFDLDIQGLSKIDDMKVQLVIHCGDVNYGFVCHRQDSTSKKFSVTIPPLNHIERSAYQYSIEVVVDGYHFVPTTGTANFTQDPFVGASSAPTIRHPEGDRVTSAPRIEMPEHREPKRNSGKSIKALAEEAKTKLRPAEKPKPKKKGVDPSLNEELLAILENINQKPTQPAITKVKPNQ